MEPGDVISLVAVIAAVGTAIVGVIVGIVDRRHARKIAEEDRAAAMKQSRLLAELEAAKRLSILEARGGHTDPVIRSDMGAETLALIAFLGKDRVPEMWSRRVGKSDDELRAFVQDQSQEQFLRDAVEAERAVHDVSREIRSLEGNRDR